jgi:predicted transcriptional regulator of viral defense system
MPGKAYSSLHDLAGDQHGYFTVAQARAWGVSRMALVMMARRCTVERVSHGVYRLVQFPLSSLGQYMEATLWPGGGVQGVISHESALSMYDVSDVSPAKIHVTVPRGFRTHRDVPQRLVLHHSVLDPDDLDTFEGIPVTTLERAIRDCAAAQLGPALIRQAIDDGQRKALLTEPVSSRLRAELLPA